MNKQRQFIRPCDPNQNVRPAWRESIGQAKRAPYLERTLLLSRYAMLPESRDCYARLRALPRPVRRRLQRKWRQPLAGLALLLALGPAPALAATINVDGINCTLVDAITAANIDNAIGLCTAGSGPDTLVLTAGSTHTLTTVNNSTDGPNGLPVVTSGITIAGNNSTIARSQVTGTPEFRLLAVGSTGDLILQSLALTGGDVDSSIGGDAGAGVLNRGILTLINSTVRGNTAATGGGVFNNGTVTLANSTVSGNTATNGGGVSSNGTVVLNNSAISDNTAGRNGGGVFTNGPVTLTASTISGNTASLVGGGAASNSTVTLTNSTVSGNTTGLFGGGVGSITLTLINSTVSGNSAGAGYGGVSTSNLTIARTLISGNTAPAGSEIGVGATGTIASDGFNLVGHSGLTSAEAAVGFTPGVTDIIATSNGNRPTALAFIINPILASNGGLTQTHALTLGSPAVDAVTAGCPPPTRDQRGVPRPQDGNNDAVARCDVGAFELVPPGTVTCDGLPATKVGTRASQILTGTSGPDVIQGLGGNDVIQGLAGNDILCGGPGNDRVLAGLGADRLFGGAGIDRLNGALGFDRCNGGPPATGDTAANCEQLSNVP